ncbi:unnamed protein product [Miscanthus lutarioriparius]|uniref:Disease resistance protein At4g27190-like leucine-rich repeats domain-containing protein n=1 Tax=Miscanthus lutarioriparius TaxID=422564 RepID=A0A811QNY8_9POAL|nr:unnamed protein product [Miscanthus lutarioriparius]
MRTELIEADTIDEATKRILKELKEDAAGTASSSSSRRNVIYFDGWDGLGASAVLREVGRRLTAAASEEEPEPAPAGRRVPAAAVLEFAHIFHIDCSKWESRRAMQRIIAEQVELPAPVMDKLDAEDEADDFQGLANGSRAEIQGVSEAISEHIRKLNRRFVVIFHNGSNEEIDLDSFGIPVSARYSRNKVLWSFQGRFRLYPRMKVDMALKGTSTRTDVVLSASAAATASKGDLSDILNHEAAEVASQINIGGIDWSAAATNCFLYTMNLCGIGSRLSDYDLVNHGCNYWTCDGIIQLQQGDVGTDGDESLWLFSDALQREMRLDTDYQNPYVPSPVVKHFPERISYWSSPIYGFTLIPDHHQYRCIPKGMFQQLDKLHVLKISACEFSFTSPPFLYCNNLRFLWLDHCKQGSSSTDEVADEEDLRRCFQRMWVLDVRYPPTSDFLPARMMDFMTQLRELNVVGDSYLGLDRLLDGRRLRNIRKLRVTDSGIQCRIDRPTDLFSGMDKLELLEFSRNRAIFMMDSLSVESSCSSLETVIIDGSFGLHARRERYMAHLRIDTTQKVGTTIGGRSAPAEFDWHISVRDTRLLGSLEPIKDYFDSYCAHVEISTVSSPAHPGVPAATAIATNKGGTENGRQQMEVNLQHQQLLKDNALNPYVAVTLKYTSMQQQDKEGDYDVWEETMCACPPPPCVPSQGCYVHIEDQMGTTLQNASITVPGFICESAKILHVHDSLFITSGAESSGATTWNQLEWCRVERCPKLKCVFTSEKIRGGSEIGVDVFKKLRTLWASHLLNARYIWNWCAVFGFEDRAFTDLTLLHLSHCPRMTYVVSLHDAMRALESLETLEIMWCGDLSVVFGFSEIGDYWSHGGRWHFPKLKRIHLHELPKLQRICSIGSNMYAPNLETIKIRGCWSFKRLPIIGDNKVVECDCEKELWDRMEWDSFVQPKHYKPLHSRYYKKTMLRTSVLR